MLRGKSARQTPPEQPELIPQLLTVRQVAQRLAISRAKAYALVESGRLPAIRIDRSVRVSSTALKLWLDQISA